MRYGGLRRYFLMLAAAASPVPSVACGGSVSSAEDSGATIGTGGTGGYPFAPGTGGYPFAPGLIIGGAGGTGGTGGYPFAPGTGGCQSCYPPDPPDVQDAGTGIGDIDAGRGADGAGPVDGGAVICIAEGGEGGPVQCSARRPPGLRSAPRAVDCDLRAYFAEMARLEAASVTAFRVLEKELVLHGAPPALRRFARRAAREEIRHARMGRALARRFGALYRRPSIGPRPPRSIEAIATDNAAEGCVRETFGAVIATWQARAAGDSSVRAVMRQIAIDETRHAALALRIAEWANGRLEPAARARVLEVRRGIGQQVLREAEYQPSVALVAVAGVPRREDARMLATAMNERLWA